jgi:hypothetical protein
MSLHYHGTPITPISALQQLAGRHFCVSFARPSDIARAHQIGQSVMLDNGAFSVWRRGHHADWPAYYAWSDIWLDHPTTWAVIPDVIDGDADQQDALIAQWPHGDRGAPVWHMHEPIDRLVSLIDGWPLVCVGSSGAYARGVEDAAQRLREPTDADMWRAKNAFVAAHDRKAADAASVTPTEYPDDGGGPVGYGIRAALRALAPGGAT